MKIVFVSVLLFILPSLVFSNNIQFNFSSDSNVALSFQVNCIAQPDAGDLYGSILGDSSTASKELRIDAESPVDTLTIEMGELHEDALEIKSYCQVSNLQVENEPVIEGESESTGSSEADSFDVFCGYSEIKDSVKYNVQLSIIDGKIISTVSPG